MNTKYIKMIIITLTILIVIFAVVFLIKNKDLGTTSNQTDSEGNIQNTDRPVLNTQTKTDISTNTNSTSSNNQNTQTSNNTNIIEGQIGVEDIKYKKITKLLYDWETIKDVQMLKEALFLSENADNEAILEAWKSFISKHSGELMKIVNSSSDVQKDARNIYSIFEWYVELSGDYEKLSSSKKQEITTQYKQLKNILNIK